MNSLDRMRRMLISGADSVGWQMHCRNIPSKATRSSLAFENDHQARVCQHFQNSFIGLMMSSFLIKCSSDLRSGYKLSNLFEAYGRLEVVTDWKEGIVCSMAYLKKYFSKEGRVFNEFGRYSLNIIQVIPPIWNSPINRSVFSDSESQSVQSSTWTDQVEATRSVIQTAARLSLEWSHFI